MRTLTLLAAITSLLFVFIDASPLGAAEVQKVVPPTLNPSSAYLLLRMGERTPGLWNLLSIAAYDEKLEDVRGKGRAKGNPVAKTDDRNIVIGPKSFIDEQNHVRTYLVALSPGRYVIVGGPTTCFCLGSYQFDAKAGQITDLGTIYMGPENGSSSWAALSSLRSSPDIEERGYTVADAIAIYPWMKEMSLPKAVEALPREPATFLPARRIGNHNGQLLNRALPLAGQK